VLTSNVMCHRVSILNAIILNYHIQTNGKYMYIHIYIHACMHTYVRTYIHTYLYIYHVNVCLNVLFRSPEQLGMIRD
jgi:hypothetical protein